MQLIKIHKLTDTGEFYTTAKGSNTLDVPARIGWDSDSPQPLVGVRLKMEDFE